MIRTASISLTLLVLSATLHAQSGIVYVPSAKATTIIEKSGQVAATSTVRVSANRRTRAGQVEVHRLDTDTFFILDGEATFVAGGAAVGLKRSAPDEQRGKSITGGQMYELRKGDVVVIPAGTPHWFKDVPREVVYYTVKARGH